MPPFNEARRDRLADASIEILAREGARGLTHRAVDAEAGEPPGTTSRYFRSRDALLRGAASRARELHFADIAASSGDLVPVVHLALTRNRSRHLAMFELFLESTRRPELHELLIETRTAQIELIRERLGISKERAALLVSAITGLVVIGLTTPTAIGVHSPDDMTALVRGMLRGMMGG